MLRTIMLRTITLGGVFFVPALLAANPPIAETDLDNVQGYWKLLQCEYEGKAQMPADIMKQVTVVFDKNEYHLYFKEKELDKNGKPIILRLARANVTLDATTNPKTITFEFADGPLKGKKSHGIYELAGNQLKLCYGPMDKPKPTRFESSAGSGYFLETWARQPR